MYKQKITYEDFDGEMVTETLYFNITRSRLMANLTLQDELEDLQSDLSGIERELTNTEKQRILDMVKKFMELSYGIRSADGKKHDQRPEVWEEFQQTAAYDAYLMSLFAENKAMDFLIAVMPKSLMEQVEKENPEMKLRSVDDVELPPEIEIKSPRDMTEEELREAYRKKLEEL